MGEGIWFGVTGPEQVRRASADGLPSVGSPSADGVSMQRVVQCGVLEPEQMT